MDPSLRPFLVVWTILAVLFAFLTPPYEAPDEPFHLAYANHLATGKGLPNQYDPQRFVYGEGHQFPLYYLGAGALIWLSNADHAVNVKPIANPQYARNGGPTWMAPAFAHNTQRIFPSAADRASFYGLRLLSVLLALLNLVVLERLAALYLADGRWRVVAVLLAGGLPQYLYVAGYITNDNLNVLLSTLCIYACCRCVRQPERRWFLWLGLFLGLALATKKNALVLLPAVALSLGALWWQRPDARRRILLGMLGGLGLTLLLAGWVFLRNQGLYGEFLGTRMEAKTLPDLIVDRHLLSWDFARYVGQVVLPGLAISAVGYFGWMTFPLPLWMYGCWAAIALLALGGVLGGLPAWRRRWLEALPLALFPAFCLAGIVHYNLAYSQYQGRFLFPILGCLTIPAAAGLARLCRPWPRLAPGVRVVLTGVILVVAVSALLYLHGRYYYRECYLP